MVTQLEITIGLLQMINVLVIQSLNSKKIRKSVYRQAKPFLEIWEFHNDYLACDCSIDACDGNDIESTFL